MLGPPREWMQSTAGSGMSTSAAAGAASLAEFVRGTQDAEFDDGDAERVARVVANTKNVFAALADHPRFDTEPADLGPLLARLAPAALREGGAGGAP